jgi:hypothetical protein
MSTLSSRAGIPDQKARAFIPVYASADAWEADFAGDITREGDPPGR